MSRRIIGTLYLLLVLIALSQCATDRGIIESDTIDKDPGPKNEQMQERGTRDDDDRMPPGNGGSK